MKFDTIMLIVKGWFIASAAAAGAMAGGLTQLPKDVTVIGHIPLPIVSLWCSVYSAFSVAAIGFLSSSFSDFVKKRNGGSTPGLQTDFFGRTLPTNPPQGPQSIPTIK